MRGCPASARASSISRNSSVVSSPAIAPGDLRQADAGNRFGRQSPCLGVGLGADIGADDHVVRDRHAQEWAHDLEGPADAGLTELMRLAARHVAPVEENFAGAGPQESVQQVEQRGLAGAVGTDDSKDLVSPQFEADVLDGFQSAEGTRQVADLENDIVRSLGSFRARRLCRRRSGLRRAEPVRSTLPQLATPAACAGRSRSFQNKPSGASRMTHMIARP